MNRPSLSHHRSSQGFSLTEVAIVLGVIGMIMGGIWVALSAGTEYYHREQAAEQIGIVVNNVRSLYAARMGTNLGYRNFTNQMLSKQVLPSYMQQATGCRAGFQCADNPWGSNSNNAGGTFRVCAWTMGAAPAMAACPALNLATPTQFFAVELTHLSIGSCIALVGHVSSSSGSSGLINVVINGAALVEAGVSVRPVPTAALNANCTLAANANVVDFVYQLTTPPS